MKWQFVPAAILALLVGCADLGYVMDEYGNVKPLDVVVPEGNSTSTYVVYDRPDQQRLMIRAHWGRDTAPKRLLQPAAAQYLREHRPACTLRDGERIGDTTAYEFEYLCD